MPRKSGSGSSAFGAYGPRGPRCRECGRQFNERTAGALNRTQYPSDRIALVVPWRLRYRLTLRDLSEMFLARGLVSVARRCVSGRRSPLPIPSDELRQRRGRRRPSATCHWSQDSAETSPAGRDSCVSAPSRAGQSPCGQFDRSPPRWPASAAEHCAALYTRMRTTQSPNRTNGPRVTVATVAGESGSQDKVKTTKGNVKWPADQPPGSQRMRRRRALLRMEFPLGPLPPRKGSPRGSTACP